MKDTLHSTEKGEQITDRCAIPLPKGNENNVRLATQYAWAFSQALEGKHYVVLCNVPVPLTQAITLGAWMAGHPVTCLDPALSKSQLDNALSQLRNTLNIGSPNCLSRPEDKLAWLSPDVDETNSNHLHDWLRKHGREDTFIPHKWRDDECAIILFTSGSTGMPKGVCHSIGNLRRSAELYIRQFGINGHDRLLNLAPVHAVSGLRGSVFIPLLTGCHLTETPKVSDLEGVLSIFCSERPTLAICGPLLFRQLAMLADKLDDELSSIRAFFSTGAKLDRNSRVRIWERHRIPILDYYGLTETMGLIIGEKIEGYNPEVTSIGKECTGVTVELTEVEGISDPEMKLGQLRIHSPNLFLGYLGEPLERKQYFDTGDLGERDEAGNIFLKGRLDHSVKASNTRWLYPQALEQLLVNRSDIADAHVRSGYDPYDRGVLYAKVVPANPEAIDDDWVATLFKYIDDQLGPDYKATDIEIVSSIPRTALGKVIKE